MAWRRDYWLWVLFFVIGLVSPPVGQLGPVDSFIRDVLEDRRGGIYSVLVGLEGTVLGFIIAALTIVIGYSTSPRFEILRDSRHWSAIFQAYTRGAKGIAVALLFALVGLIFDSDKAPNAPLTVANTAALLVAGVLISRVIYVTERVVKVVINTRPRAAGE